MSHARLLKITFVGKGGSGKSSFRQRLKDNKFTSAYMPTIGVDFGIVDYEVAGYKTTLQIWDCAGQSKYQTPLKAYYQDTFAVVVFLDSTDTPEENEECLKAQIRTAQDLVGPDISVYVIRSKSDLIAKVKSSESQISTLVENNNCKFLGSFSAKDGSQDVAAKLIITVAQDAQQNLIYEDADLEPVQTEPDTAVKLRDDLITCLRSCADNFKGADVHDEKLSRCEIRSRDKILAILTVYNIEMPVDKNTLLESIHDISNRILEANEAMQRYARLDNHIKSLLGNKKITQPRNRLSSGSKIKDSLTSLYAPAQRRTNKIEKLVTALINCLEKCVKDGTVPNNRHPDQFAMNSRKKAGEILSVFRFNHAQDWNAIKLFCADSHNISLLENAIRDKASSSDNLDDYIASLYKSALTENRGRKTSTLKNELGKLLPSALLKSNALHI